MANVASEVWNAFTATRTLGRPTEESLGDLKVERTEPIECRIEIEKRFCKVVARVVFSGHVEIEKCIVVANCTIK